MERPQTVVWFATLDGAQGERLVLERVGIGESSVNRWHLKYSQRKEESHPSRVLFLLASPPDPSGPSSPSSGGHPGNNAAGSWGRTPCPGPQRAAPGCPPELPGAAASGPPAGTPPPWERLALQGTMPHLRRCSPAWVGGEAGDHKEHLALCLPLALVFKAPPPQDCVVSLALALSFLSLLTWVRGCKGK